jgi:hypothetical protein
MAKVTRIEVESLPATKTWRIQSSLPGAASW